MTGEGGVGWTVGSPVGRAVGSGVGGTVGDMVGGIIGNGVGVGVGSEVQVMVVYSTLVEYPFPLTRTVKSSDDDPSHGV